MAQPPNNKDSTGIDPKDHGSELVNFALPHDFGANLYYLDKKSRRLLELVGHGMPLAKYLTHSKPVFRILRIIKTLERIDDDFGTYWNDNEHRIGDVFSGTKFDELFAPRFLYIRNIADTIHRILERIEGRVERQNAHPSDIAAWREAIKISEAISYFADRSQYYIKGLTQLAKYNQIIDRQTTNLNTFFSQQRTLLIEGDRRTDLDILNTLPTVRIDYSHCFTLFSNLIRNSLKYRRGSKCSIKIAFDPRDGRDIRHELRLPLFVPTLRPSQSHASLHIIDDGIGIPKNDLERIFEPFRRGMDRDSEAERATQHTKAQHETKPFHASRLTDYSGVGLGLAIAQRVAVLYDGDLYANSTLGEGTCMSVDLSYRMIINQRRLVGDRGDH